MRTSDTGAFFESDYAKFNYERWEYEPEGRADFLDTLGFITASLGDKAGSGFSCLELGSGPGIWVKEMRRLGCARYHAVDISRNMLSLNPADRVFVHDLNEGLPPGIDSAYDVILAVHSFEYIQDHRALARAALDRLNRGGRLIIVTKNKRARAWRAVKKAADLLSGTCLRQYWRDAGDFAFAHTRITAEGLNCRIPVVLNNVNDSFRLKPAAGPVRRFVHRRINPGLKKSPGSPFAWHVGLVIQRDRP